MWTHAPPSWQYDDFRQRRVPIPAPSPALDDGMDKVRDFAGLRAMPSTASSSTGPWNWSSCTDWPDPGNAPTSKGSTRRVMWSRRLMSIRCLSCCRATRRPPTRMCRAASLVVSTHTPGMGVTGVYYFRDPQVVN